MWNLELNFHLDNLRVDEVVRHLGLPPRPAGPETQSSTRLTEVPKVRFRPCWAPLGRRTHGRGGYKI